MGREPTDLDDTHGNGHPLDTAIGLGENGHTTRNPAWPDREAEFIPLAYKQRRRSLWRWLMSTRPMRAAATEVDTSRRPTLATLLMFSGLFIWLATTTLNGANRNGHVDEKITTLEATQKKLMDERDENIRLKERVDSLVRQRTELSQYVGELAMWSADVRTKLLTTGRGRSIEVPPLPERNGRGLGE